MTALQRNKILTNILTVVGIILLLSVAQIVHSNRVISKNTQDLTTLEQSYRESIARENDLALLSDIKDMEIEKLNNALDTALKDNMVIQTLLNKDMEEWTPEGILAMRDKLASLPYGSWFESGHIVTAPFGSRQLTGTYWKSDHPGVDIFPKSYVINERILSAIDGKVVTWGRNDRVYGNYLIIESLDGQYQIKLAHLSAIGIVAGDKVDLKEGMTFKAGQQIARMGNTGLTTGNDNEGHHLHLEYYIHESEGWRLLNASAILDYIGKPKEIKE